MRSLVITAMIISFVSSMSGAVFGQDMESMFKELQTLKARLDTQDEEIKYLRLKVAKEELEKVSAPATGGDVVKNYDKTPEAKAETGVTGNKPLSTATAQIGTTASRGFFGDLKTTLTGLGEWSEKPDPLIKVGQGWLKIGGLFQEWFVHDELATARDEFRTRRMEIKLYGEIIPKLKYQVMFDPAKRFPRTASDGSTLRDNTDTAGTLQDAFVTFTHIPHHELTLGQFKIPVIEEGFRSSAKLDFVERSRIARTFSDRRDIGIMLKGDYKLLEYYLALVNGEETNSKDLNDRKDYMARLVLKPFRGWGDSPLKGFEFGGSYYNGRRGVHRTVKDFWGAEARYQWEKLALKAEYVAARDDDSTLKTLSPIHRDGWYAQAGYRLFKPLEGMVRYEEFRNNKDQHGNENRDWTFGLNWFLNENYAKFQLNYVLKSVDGARDKKPDDQVIAAMQIHF
ncbi:MAG TPA: porin [Candidatus Tripitaka californicus]|uniref:porin n=1 Tax=Candidatus Tripitaka californicus TaxID=3367616 RepID=UPI004026CEBF